MSRLLTAEQLAERWQVPRSHVYRQSRLWIETDGTEGVPTVVIGRYYRYRPDVIAAWEVGAPGDPDPAGVGSGHNEKRPRTTQMAGGMAQEVAPS